MLEYILKKFLIACYKQSMEKEQLTPLKLVHHPESPYDYCEHYEINNVYCCKDIGDIIVTRFPDVLTKGANPIDIWISLYDSNDQDYEAGSDILDTLPVSERDFIDDYLRSFEGGKYEIFMDDEDDDDMDLDEEVDEWDSDPDLGPNVD